MLILLVFDWLHLPLHLSHCSAFDSETDCPSFCFFLRPWSHEHHVVAAQVISPARSEPPSPQSSCKESDQHNSTHRIHCQSKKKMNPQESGFIAFILSESVYMIPSQKKGKMLSLGWYPNVQKLKDTSLYLIHL